ncbi:COG4223 family protein [Eilatimonas milleporae]|uniref:Inner membrane protein n=1 Tax=Eilatimonas milleporae TaxID=911205 RepID=A0A3M0BTC7_9PROT|nr:hypothetical protein [Eilatimonas milleporae]RMB00568.1 hypothetical protein BXY39_3755 [Eilatimonas milleporae]
MTTTSGPEKTDPASSPGDTPDNDDVLDAEVIAEETPAPSRGGIRDTEKPGEERQRRRGPVGLIAWGLVLLMGGGLAGVYFAPDFDAGLQRLGLRQAPGAGDAARAERARLEDRIARLETVSGRLTRALAALDDEMSAMGPRLDTLEARPATGAGATAGATPGAISRVDETALRDTAAGVDRLDTALTDVRDRLGTLSADVDKLLPRIQRVETVTGRALEERAVLARQVDGLSGTLNALTTEIRQPAGLSARPEGRMSLSLIALQGTALSGREYGAALDTFRAALSDLPSPRADGFARFVEVLSTHRQGVLPFDRLAADFDGVANAIVAARDKTEGRFLAGLFSVRRTDAAAEGLDATLRDAERQLGRGDLKGAVGTIAALDPAVRKPAQDWLAAARDHMAVKQALDGLAAELAVAAQADVSEPALPAMDPETDNESSLP